jgi:hypothetical protein
LRGFRDIWQEWRDQLAPLVRSEVGEDVPEKDVQAMTSLILSIFNGLVLHATLESESLDLERIAQLQQYGWDGIIERVKADGPASEEPAQGTRKGRRK